MLQRTLALMTRAFRSDARDIRTHLFRLALPALFMFTVFLFHMDNGLRSAPGLELFWWLIIYDYIFITFAAGTFFATAVAEEREQQTLGLLRMADVGPIAILLGKWLPRMWTAILLLCIQLPFTLLCVTLGGVLWSHIIAAFACVLAHLILVGGLALLCSVCSRDVSTACGWTTVLIVLYHAGVWIFSALFYRYVDVSLVSDFLGFNRLIDGVLESSFMGSALSYQVFGNLIVGSFFMLMAWALFDPLTTREAAESRTSISQILRHATSGKLRRAWSEAPLLWQGFHYVAGGPTWLFIRMGFYLCAVFTLILVWWAPFSRRLDPELIGGCFFMCGMMGTIAEGAYLSAQVFRIEIAGQTWGTLCMLPEDLSSIVYPRLLGTFMGLAPGLACMMFGTLLLADELMDVIDDDDFWMITFIFSALVVWGWHLTTLFSITIDWSAWPISILLATMVVIMFFTCTVVCAETTDADEAGVWLAAFFVWGLSLATHLAIGEKLKSRMAE